MSEAIKQYISTKYDQHPDMFRRDLQQIDKMRADAVNSLEAHASGIRNLTSYAAQLVWIGGKFPIDVSPTAGRGEITMTMQIHTYLGMRADAEPPS
jgi:hypothetical protein